MSIRRSNRLMNSGALVSLLWDEHGTSYPHWHHTAGFSIYINGKLVHHQKNLAPVNVTMPHQTSSITALSNSVRYANILANPNSPHQLPYITATTHYQPSGSHSESFPAWKLNDGLVLYDTT